MSILTIFASIILLAVVSRDIFILTSQFVVLRHHNKIWEQTGLGYLDIAIHNLRVEEDHVYPYNSTNYPKYSTVIVILVEH